MKIGCVTDSHNHLLPRGSGQPAEITPRSVRPLLLDGVIHKLAGR